ncbi:transmembrane channel-like protein 3 [Pseudomyrmex gracilis]|uniref:transmembrane channel-like protein 3 n=1 Tax=Pseudomyrmex gracilis TaxID=219809 RepID=UPI000995DEE2|nr:transmembrane channel-like protein 3 [Pseudomyrmex gracilis]
MTHYASDSQSISSLNRTKTSGILKPDKMSRSFKATSSSLALVGPSSSSSQPQPSAGRQSVTFAIVESSRNEDSEKKFELQTVGTELARSRNDMHRISVAAISKRMDPAAVSTEKTTSADGEGNGSEDDYSASVCAIMQRRNTIRRQSRRKRRPSSPFNVDVDNAVRRRSSAYTTSSGDTIISMEESGNQEQIFENLKLHKEVLSGVKQQPWSLRRKMKLVRQAKSYVRRHEGALQERLAQSHSTKDVIARVTIFATKKWQYFRRELINLRTWLIPWEIRIMEIESHFGSAVASYFIFLRWLFWINFVIAATLATFVTIPEILTANATLAGERKHVPEEEAIKSKHLLTLWEFEGVLKYSAFFYGWYTNQDSNRNYRLPLAYFVTNLVVYTYSFVAILRKMAENSRLSKLTEKEEEYIFSWKLFTGWDFMIGNPETSHNRTASIVVGFKEALLEEAEKQKDKRNWKIISMRIFVNVAVLSLLALSAYAVIKVVERSIIDSRNWWRQNEITIVMSLITYLFPILFEILGFLESYHPRKQLRIQLARIMVLNLLNLYSLIFALFHKIGTMKHDLYGYLKPTSKNCTYKNIPCGNKLTQRIAKMASLSLLASNVTHFHAKREISESTLPYVGQQVFLNPLFTVDALYDDFNDTYDYPDTYYDITNYDYGTSDNGDELYTAFSYKDIPTTDSNLTHYDASSTVVAKFLTNSTTAENLYTSSITSSQSETAPSTIIEQNATEESSEITDVDVFSKSPTISLPSDNKISGRKVSDAATTITTYISESSVSTLRSNEDANSPSEEERVIICLEKICTTAQTNLAKSLDQLDPKTRKKLRRLCWETMFGQELAKLTVMDLILTILATLIMDFFRAVLVRFMNNCWCWDLEKQFPQYGDFKIAENILHLVNNQGMVWMGMFFSPGLTVLNLVKLGILMYLRSWAVLTCNVPHEVVFRASRSNNFYFALLLTMLFLCVLPVGYAIVWVEPSSHCGPFSGYPKIYNLATQSLISTLPKPIQRCLDYVASPGIIIPLIVLMALIIYYMASLAGSLREANNDLKMQLRHERTEERRKLFRIAGKRQNVTDTPLSRWKKILPALPQTKTGISRNSEVAEKNNVQTESSGSDAIERKQLANDGKSLRHNQTSRCNEEKQNEREDNSKLNDTIFSKTIRPDNFVGCSWDSQLSEQTVISEIEENDKRGEVTSDIRESELSNISENHDQQTT